MPCGPNSICTPIFRRPSSLENVASCSCKMEYIGRPPNCRLKLIPVLCKLSDWSKWSTCSQTCGKGKKTRRRTVITEASNGGRQCEKGRMQDRPCEILPCPVAVNCKLSNWNMWSTCSKTCGEGKQTRRRTVIPEASGRCRCGRQCRNGRVEDRPCEILPCPPECQLSEWSNWSTCRCSKASGTGKQTRWKTDISNCKFVNRKFEDRRCNKFPCTQSCIEKHNQFLCWNTVFDLQGVLKEKKEECAKLCYSHSTCEGWSFNGHTIQYNKVGPLNLGTSIEMLLHPSMKWIWLLSSSLFFVCLTYALFNLYK